MRINSIIILLCLTVSSFMYAQDGSPFLTNFLTSDQSLNENYSITQNKDGLIILANRKGVLIFDADEWQLVKTPEVPYVVAFNEKNGLVYVGCNNDIGYLRKSDTGGFEYFSIGNKKMNHDSYAQIAFSEKYAYFLSPTNIVIVDIVNNTLIKELKSDVEKPFSTLITLKGSVLVDVFNDGLYVLAENNKKLLLTQKDFYLCGKVLFSETYDTDRVLLGSSENALYLFDGAKLSRYQFQDQQYVKDGILSGATSIDQNSIAIATVNAGCIIIEKQSGKTLYSVNFETGLPDDEIFAIGHDNNSGVWLAHYFGLSRIDTKLPIRNLNSFKGLSGNIQYVESFNNKIYISTSNGIYFLDKRVDYVEYNRKESQKQADESNVNTHELPENNAQKGGFFNKLFKRKNNDEKTQNTSYNEGNKANSLPKRIYKLQSISHSYLKIEEFDSRCRQMVNANGHLLVASNQGLFEIIGKKVSNVISDLSINYIYVPSKSKTVYACTEKGIKMLNFSEGKWEISDFQYGANENIYSFAIDVFNNYWIGSDNKVIRLKIRNNQIKETKEFKFTTDFHERVMVRISNKKPLFFLTNEIYAIFNDSIQPFRTLSKYVGTETDFFFMQNDFTWIRNDRDWVLLRSDVAPDTSSYSFLNLFKNVNCIFDQKQEYLWIIDDNTTVYKIDTKKINDYKSDFNAFIKSFTGITGDRFSLKGVSIDNNNHSLNILISAPYFVKTNSNQYQYLIKGQMNDWSSWKSTPEITFFVQNSGDYEMKVRARNIFGNISNEEVLKFQIKRAFYETWWFYSIIILGIAFLVYTIIYLRTIQLRRENQILEQKVQERTQQIQHQKEEIEGQRNQIAQQNLEITDSIRYAKRLQTAVMPDENILNHLLGKEYFIIYRPKDIVSGDFYWLNNTGGKIVVCAADCTGHGVPGGFLSMLGVSLLNELSATDRDFCANDILNFLRLKLKHTLIKDGDPMETKDGMDVALCIIDKKSNKLEYAGANNPLWILRNGEMLEFKADKMPIGSYIEEKDSFTNHSIDLLSNDVLYLFSDGFRDQLGGPNAKRMKSSSFRNALLEFGSLPMDQQKIKLEKHYDDWRGEYEQVDDILVIGIKI